MSDLWKKRTPPNPLQWNDLPDETAAMNNGNEALARDQKVWSIKECAKIFNDAINSLKSAFIKLADGDFLSWDKDDRDAMDFVASCANIRANIFGIPQKSRFEVKSMAGNIIPAIATTNAITAGFVVMHAFKVLQGKFNDCRTVYVKNRADSRHFIFAPDKFLIPPNPKCYVCAPNPSVSLIVDTKKMTVKQFQDNVLIKALNMISPDVMIESKGVVVISSDDDEMDENNEKKLCDMSIVDGFILKVDDFFQNYTLVVTIIHKDCERDEALFEVVGDPDLLKPQQTNEPEVNNVATEISDEPANKKRKIDFEEAGPSGLNTTNVGNDVDDDDDDDDDCAIVEENDNQEDDCAVVNDQPGETASSIGERVNRKRVHSTDELNDKRARLEIDGSDGDDDDVVLID